MKLVWVSPCGSGAVVAERIRTAGHSVVGYGRDLAALPQIERQHLATFCTAADVVVVDGPFPLVKTKRSWRPAQDALFFDELRRYHHVVALGPTPTLDLLAGDRRYLRKLCGRFGVPYEEHAVGEPWSSGAWFRGRDIVPLGPYLTPWVPLFKSVGFRGWFEVLGVLGTDAPLVTGCRVAWDPTTIPEGREAEFLQEMLS